MTTHNGEPYVERQLATIVAQDRLPDEIVVTDDCSSDGTWEQLTTFATRVDVPVQIERNESNLGLRRNIEKTLGKCRGDVIVLADQDDEWASGKLAAVATAFQKPDVALWISDGELIDADGARLGETVWSAVHLDARARGALERGGGVEQLLHGQLVTGATMAIRRSLLDLALPLPAELEGTAHLFLHDGWLAALARCVGDVVLDDRALVRYRQHSAQVTSMSMSMSAAPADTAAPSTSEALALARMRTRLVFERLSAHGIDTDQAQEIKARVEYLDLRSQVRSGDLRVGRMLRHARPYARFGRGARSMMADIVHGARARTAGPRR